MMSVIVKTAARVLLLFISVYGIYIVANGHLTPGGGFQGGVVIATGFMLVLLGYGKSAEEVFKEAKLGLSENAGSIVYVSVGFIGLLAGGAFLQNKGVFPLGNLYDLWSAGFMPTLNYAIGAKVTAGIATVALMFLALIWKDEKDETVGHGTEEAMK
ncbi:MAG: MnhB domain-containing protein [Candidatus Micrarchaeota archaeon]